jgi:hypothetical protein
MLYVVIQGKEGTRILWRSADVRMTARRGDTVPATQKQETSMSTVRITWVWTTVC